MRSLAIALQPAYPKYGISDQNLDLQTHCAATHARFNSEFTNTQTELIDFSLTVKAATLIFISGRGAISSAKEGKSCSMYNLVKS